MMPPPAASFIIKDRAEQAALMRERLEQLGITIEIAYYDGNERFPTDYTLTYSPIRASAPTLDLALIAFVEQLLKATAQSPN